MPLNKCTMENKEIKLQMKELIKLMSEGVWEKEDIFSLALLSSIAGESIFLLGPPGTGKSMIARRLKEVFAEKKQFEYLMSRFSTPDEIFGPVSISKLKVRILTKEGQKGIYHGQMWCFWMKSGKRGLPFKMPC